MREKSQSQAAALSSSKGADSAPAPALSLKQPIWHVLVLGVLTFKLYFIYWCYKNWRDLSRQLFPDERRNQEVPEESPIESVLPDASSREDLFFKMSPLHLSEFKDCSPLLRSVVLLIPYLNNYMFFTLAFGVARLYPEPNSLVKKHPLFCSLVVVVTWSSLAYLSLLSGPAFLLFLLCVIPIAVVQLWLNKYWDSVEEPGLLTRHGFNGWELLAVIVGALGLGFIISGFMLGQNK